jgi:hypothetical protein
MEWHAESRLGLLFSPIAWRPWRPWRLGGWFLVIEPPRTPRGRFSISHQRKIKNRKKILGDSSTISHCNLSKIMK